ncbi:CLI_3235 family bacteriocin precursor [Paenibacillus motobuensis]|uniref:Bacteriocin n=1 Tax=Paenibacillus motobuensis TaxID=295324 RepID=A0ABN0XXV5_9BACL
MKKLGKKVAGAKGTLMAYACSCGSCPCSSSQCTCKTTASATHKNALTTSSSTSYNMQYTALGIGS